MYRPQLGVLSQLPSIKSQRYMQLTDCQQGNKYNRALFNTQTNNTASRSNKNTQMDERFQSIIYIRNTTEATTKL